ncbi:MAG: adenylyltransferase/cytidyltransferase family protein [Candidatus ainarchaeum sp.]|jgi:cytidyltransferase-like protein|nr:adenylyltransferase/cytidyltransferase family protein [Candidatus ainarchaeum sp.]MDD3085911.1 adenylyltransferase/cytidyltransferase family protein [Candidatus ainarchaeum sp.]MDD4128196.1 adenylyltransferase/cytidyltransferase family protein [Candidatus ainarchaeum sp.]MDD4468185.1 adenylyltransferase/cytidyltransferase family protein [Candidatus ainarchaeum sp.]HPM85990.1 adenylyltransferase/cytidyltransferase family protein [archaeon]
MKIVITSGYFDPIHEGHIECLNKAKKLGDKLIVIINNDEQAVLKKGKPFMNQKIREIIVSNLKSVDETILSIDKDNSVCESIKLIYLKYCQGNEFIFAKGGDRLLGEIPEKRVCEEFKIKIIDGLGAKINSSKNYYKK